MKKIVALMIVSALITACSSRYASNGENLYQRSQNGPNLVIPRPLTSEMISHFYDLPQPTQSPSVSLAPPAA